MESALYYFFLCLHLIGATIWAGGHLILALTVLPDALKQKNSSLVLEFEKRFEKIGLHVLGTQVISGLWLAWHLLGWPNNWFANNSTAHGIQVKLALLTLTAALAINARMRVIPKLTDENLPTLAWHIRLVTLSAVLFVLTGATIRMNGYPVF